MSAAYAARETLLVDSGTAALQLALAGVRATVGDRPIALPAYSCYDVATAADGAGVKVLLYDLDPNTLGPDRISLEHALEQHPAALVTAHLYGYPVDVDWLGAVCRDAGALLIEDAAQGAGGRLHERALGTFGSLSVLSFGRGKGTTAGAGGVLLAHDDAGAGVMAWAAPRLATALRGVRVAAVLAAQWLLGRPSLYWLPAAIPLLHLGETVYRSARPVAAMSRAAVQALRHSARRELVEAEARQRSLNARRLLERARASAKVRTIDAIAGATPGFLRLPLVNAKGRSAAVIAELARYGVASAYPNQLASLRPFRDRVLNGDDAFDGARILAERLLTFPTHSLLTEHDLRALEAWLG